MRLEVLMNGDLVKRQKEVGKLEERRNLGNLVDLGMGKKIKQGQNTESQYTETPEKLTTVTSSISGVILI